MQPDFCDDPRMPAPRPAEVVELEGGSFELRWPETLQPYARFISRKRTLHFFEASASSATLR